MGNSSDPLVKRDFQKNPITAKELTECYWYAIANDTIGGWDISNVNVPESQRNRYEGEFEIGCFISQDIAEHIVEIHNTWWEIEVWKTYAANIYLSHIDGKLNSIIPKKLRKLPKFKDLQEIFDRSRMKD